MLRTEWLGAQRFHGAGQSVHVKSPPHPPTPRIGSWTWAAVKLICSNSSPTLQWVQLDPPQLNLGCSEVDLQWLQSNFAVSAVRPPLEWVVELGLQWSWSAVIAVQLCSECSWTPPPLEWVVELGLQWSWSAVTAVQLCSECSQTPPPRMGSWTWAAVKLICSNCSPTLQWVQLDPPPGMGSWTWVAVKLICSDCSPTLQWVQSDPPPSPRMGSWTWAAVKLICSDCSPTLQWVQLDPPLEWVVELGLQWSWSAVTAVQLCSECSWTSRTLQNCNFRILNI